MERFTKEQRKKINKTALAEKHGCTSSYIRLILKGEREVKTDKAKAIIEDAAAMLRILEQNPDANV